MRNSIRFCLFVAALLMGAVHATWAQEITAAKIKSNIIQQKFPADDSGEVTVGDVTAADGGGWLVPITVEPKTGWEISKSDIVVQKMVDPSAAPRRAASIADALPLDGDDPGDLTESRDYTFVIPEDYHGALITATFRANTAKYIDQLSEITDLMGSYILKADIDDASGLSSLGSFSGTLDGGMHRIKGLKVPLFSQLNGGTVKNLILDNVAITGSGNTGAICAEATGSSRIYNCGVEATGSTVVNGKVTHNSSTVSGGTYVGGLVGFLDGTARVINCYSFADIVGGSTVGGIVGYNNVATTASNLKTMVMNCMFYGEIDVDATTSRAPVYNGQIISNKDANGVGNYNYFRAEASYVQDRKITNYHCALMAETRYLQRFEFFRHLLNSNRALAAWWVTNDINDKDIMMKWVMQPSQIGTHTPYPVLRKPGKYPSVVNPDSEHAVEGKPRNQGGKLGTLDVTIQMGDGEQFSHPSGAYLTTTRLRLNVTDKDTLHHDFNAYKVQLPYYNDVGTGNYTETSVSVNKTEARVVTGWKIVSITGGTSGSFTTASDATFNEDGTPATMPYNFADRQCTDKDLYSVSKRIFNQGAYWVVPEGVTAITIAPYWAKAAYVADSSPDVVYNSGMATKQDATTVGGGNRYTNGGTYNINGEDKKVYTSIANAKGTLGLNASHSPYDYAVVLVGNVHATAVSSGNSNEPYTIMSADFDGDNEPDYSYILRCDGRIGIHPVRIDFLSVPGLGMAQKSTGGTGTYNFGIPQPLGWFEVTNTALFRVTQLEYERDTKKANSPIILHGGVMEQWVSFQNNGTSHNVNYIHVGGNVWFKEFHLGCHQDSGTETMHPPVSVTGGDFDTFYLTGAYSSTATNRDDNAECYISGGRFGAVAGTGMEGIGHSTNHTNGNILWQIDHADIQEFYGGGINAAHIAEGSIYTIIRNSHVHQFCGGPKFGNMNTGRTVKTIATDCVFDTFFGAGYGGNSYNRRAPKNYSTNIVNLNTWNKWVNGDMANGDGFKGYKREYNSTYKGVSTQIDYQFLPLSGNTTNVARLFVDYVSFSLATTHDVTSTLKGCTINRNFYGGGSLGKVDGPVTSTLDSCTVEGSVFGAGYSATVPTVEVMNLGGFKKEPYYDSALGVYLDAIFPDTETYHWEHTDNTINSDATARDTTNHILYTREDLTALGTVDGKATLNIVGKTVVKGQVFDQNGNVTARTGGAFGGGDASAALGDTEVNIRASAAGSDVYNVFGGGNVANVSGKTTVNVHSGRISRDVFGGGYGAVTRVGGNVTVNIGSKTTTGTGTSATTTYGGSAEIFGDVYGGSALGSVNTGVSDTTAVNLYGGTIHGDAYGGGLGQIGRDAQEATETQPAVTAIEDIKAMVYGNVFVTLDGAAFTLNTSNDDKDNPLPSSGRIFGCNNLNGTPLGNVTVEVKRTVAGNRERTEEGNLNKTGDSGHSYEVAAVYGGGNLAAYEPYGPAGATATDLAADKKQTARFAHVIIDGCSTASIQQVYGGGNAASTPATQVDIKGSYEIEEVFGGGNGKDRVQKNDTWYANPGANVGYSDYTKYEEEGGELVAKDKDDADTKAKRLESSYVYGTGAANVNIYGGLIHRVYGGSNTKGNVRIVALTMLEDQSTCDEFLVDEAYGGGKSAPMDGASRLEMACIPGLKSAYGGAEAANIEGDVNLNITNGNFDRVFGGNNISGTISGTITVNVEETGCRPVIIGQLYGGGNQASYTAPKFWDEDKQDSVKQHGPTVNVRSFTSIGEVFGGGYGRTAWVDGDTYVNINVSEGLWKDTTIVAETRNFSFSEYKRKDNGDFETEGGNRIVETKNVSVSMPRHRSGEIGTIGNVFGGGNAAEVRGSTHVNVGTMVGQNQTFETKPKTKVVDGVEVPTTDADYEHFVKGVSILGNVYGGGNNADVTGKTYINVGREETPAPATPAPASEP